MRCPTPGRSTGHFFASADKAKRLLGWQPKHNFMKDVDQVGRAGSWARKCSPSAARLYPTFLLYPPLCDAVGPPPTPPHPTPPHPPTHTPTPPHPPTHSPPHPHKNNTSSQTTTPSTHPPTSCPPQLVRDFVASGRLDKQPDFSVDDRILAAVGYKVGAN